MLNIINVQYEMCKVKIKGGRKVINNRFATVPLFI